MIPTILITAVSAALAEEVFPEEVAAEAFPAEGVHLAAEVRQEDSKSTLHKLWRTLCLSDIYLYYFINIKRKEGVYYARYKNRI